MIIGISNEDVFTLIRVKIVRLMKIIRLKSATSLKISKGVSDNSYIMNYKFVVFLVPFKNTSSLYLTFLYSCSIML